MNEAIAIVTSIKFDDNTNIYNITIKIINTRFKLVLKWHNYKRKDTYERIYKTTCLYWVNMLSLVIKINELLFQTKLL